MSHIIVIYIWCVCERGCSCLSYFFAPFETDFQEHNQSLFCGGYHYWVALRLPLWSYVYNRRDTDCVSEMLLTIFIIIIISLLMSLLLGHRPFLWIIILPTHLIFILIFNIIVFIVTVSVIINMEPKTLPVVRFPILSPVWNIIPIGG
jgi:hypothetical protein